MSTATVERPRAPRSVRWPDQPLIKRTDDLIDWWSERILQVSPHADNRTQSSIIMNSDSLFHYGHHFELARIVRKSNGHARLVLLNGDRWNGSGGWGNATASRQMQVQRIVRQQVRDTDIETLLVPFSVLDSADIEPDTIVPLDVRDDRRDVVEHTSEKAPGPLAKMDDPSGATYTFEEQRHGYRYPDGRVEPEGWNLTHERREELGVTFGEYTHREERPVLVDNPNEAEVKNAGAFTYARANARRQADGTWKWTTETHRLGDSLFKGRVRWSERYTNEDGHTDYRWRTRWAKFLSSFDYNEPNRPYFMCELRRGSPATTVEEAIDDLMPAEVRDLVASGVEVLRQGDIFAIPTNLSTRDVEQLALMADITVYGPNDEGRNVQTRKPVWLRRRADSIKNARILGTSHTATHVIKSKDGYYGRGSLYHDPDGWRTAEHRRLKLGDGETWYRFVKNTVPLDKSTGSSRRGGPLQSGNSRAWMLGGAVD